MHIVLLDHGDTGAEMLGEVLHRHPLVCPSPECIVTPEAAKGAPLVVSRKVYRLVNPISAA
jgi:hypothetical protein